jgi:hypothetical protein
MGVGYALRHTHSHIIRNVELMLARWLLWIRDNKWSIVSLILIIVINDEWNELNGVIHYTDTFAHLPYSLLAVLQAKVTNTLAL